MGDRQGHPDPGIKPPEGMALRVARPHDAEAIAELMSLPGVRRGTARLPFESPELIREGLEAPPAGRSLVAAVDGTVIGHVLLECLTGRRAHIGRIGMCVHDDWTRRGIGTALMAAVIDLADNWMNLRRLELEVYVDNEAALALYRRFGFEIEGRHRGTVFREGRFMDAFGMARLNGL